MDRIRGSAQGLTRRSFVAAGTLGVGALALRPPRTAAEALGPSMPSGLWGAARTDAGLVALWSSGGRASIVQLTDQGSVAVAGVLGRPDLEVPAGIAAGGPPVVVGAGAETGRVRRSIALDHLPAHVRTSLVEEVDGPVSVADLALEEVGDRRVAAQHLHGESISVATSEPHGVLGALLAGPEPWAAVQHAPTAEGDHCSSLTVSRAGRAVLEVDDLGLAGPVSLVGPPAAPLVSVADGQGHLRVWRLGAQPHALVAPGDADRVALHVAEDRPIGLRIDPVGASLLALADGGWEVVRDVAGTAGAHRVLAVAGAEPEFLVEMPDRLVLVDGQGTVRG